MQATYEEFGCNESNVFVMGIDKGNTNENIIYFDSVYGIQYQNVSGNEGGGNPIHLLYEIQGTPTVIIIDPDRTILTKQIYPPTVNSIVDSVLVAGGIQQPCLTSVSEFKNKKLLTIGPNPVKDIAYLNLNLEEGREIELKIFNLTGQKIMEFKPEWYPPGKYFVKADLSNAPEGFYFVQVLDKNRTITTNKLILTK